MKSNETALDRYMLHQARIEAILDSLRAKLTDRVAPETSTGATSAGSPTWRKNSRKSMRTGKPERGAASSRPPKPRYGADHDRDRTKRPHRRVRGPVGGHPRHSRENRGRPSQPQRHPPPTDSGRLRRPRPPARRSQIHRGQPVGRAGAKNTTKAKPGNRPVFLCFEFVQRLDGGQAVAVEQVSVAHGGADVAKCCYNSRFSEAQKTITTL